VLLDLGLPGMDGFDVLAEIRRLDSATQVVIHTGLALADARRRALEGGAVELLEKPLALEALAALLGAAPRAQNGVQTPRS
jgi:DNA-binding response OmpR family regulator